MNNADQITQDAEYCDAVAAEYRKGVTDKTVSAACEYNAQRFDRLAGYARKAAYPPQSEIVRLREENERLTARAEAEAKGGAE